MSGRCASCTSDSCAGCVYAIRETLSTEVAEEPPEKGFRARLARWLIRWRAILA